MLTKNILLSAAVAGAILVGACSPAHEAKPIVRPEVTGVELQQVQITIVPESYETTGTVVPKVRVLFRAASWGPSPRCWSEKETR